MGGGTSSSVQWEDIHVCSPTEQRLSRDILLTSPQVFDKLIHSLFGELVRLELDPLERVVLDRQAHPFFNRFIKILGFEDSRPRNLILLYLLPHSLLLSRNAMALFLYNCSEGTWADSLRQAGKLMHPFTHIDWNTFYRLQQDLLLADKERSSSSRGSLFVMRFLTLGYDQKWKERICIREKLTTSFRQLLGGATTDLIPKAAEMKRMALTQRRRVLSRLLSHILSEVKEAAQEGQTNLGWILSPAALTSSSTAVMVPQGKLGAPVITWYTTIAEPFCFQWLTTQENAVEELLVFLRKRAQFKVESQVTVAKVELIISW